MKRSNNINPTQIWTGSKLALLIAMLICGNRAIQAQDIITYKDGSEVEAKVLEVNSNSVKYKKFSMPDGPTYEVSKTEVFMIKYPSGHKDVFNQVSNQSSEIKEKNQRQKQKHHSVGKKSALGLNAIMLPLDIGFKVGYIEFERLIGEKMSIGARLLYFEQYGYRSWETAVGPGIFTRRYINGGKGLKGFYIGSSVDLLFVEFYDSWTTQEWNSYYGYNESVDKYEYGSGVSVAVTSQLGYKFTLGRTLYIEPSISLGAYLSSTATEYSSYTELAPIAAPSLTIGVKL